MLLSLPRVPTYFPLGARSSMIDGVSSGSAPTPFRSVGSSGNGRWLRIRAISTSHSSIRTHSRPGTRSGSLMKFSSRLLGSRWRISPRAPLKLNSRTSSSIVRGCKPLPGIAWLAGGRGANWIGMSAATSSRSSACPGSLGADVTSDMEPDGAARAAAAIGMNAATDRVAGSGSRTGSPVGAGGSRHPPPAPPWKKGRKEISPRSPLNLAPPAAASSKRRCASRNPMSYPAGN